MLNFKSKRTWSWLHTGAQPEIFRNEAKNFFLWKQIIFQSIILENMCKIFIEFLKSWENENNIYMSFDSRLPCPLSSYGIKWSEISLKWQKNYVASGKYLNVKFFHRFFPLGNLCLVFGHILWVTADSSMVLRPVITERGLESHSKFVTKNIIFSFKSQLEAY